MQLTRIHRPELKDAPFQPRTLWRADEDPEAIFDWIRYQDVLVHHPFESFGSVETFLRAAVQDPHVIAIKMTLYRIGPNSPLIPLLIDAAEAGKQVAVLVELKARFDERNNILWARRLETHGIHVVYGFAELKTHAKLCLVVRQEADGVQRYVHTGTGNYNPDDGEDLHRPRPLHRRSGHRRGRLGHLQLSDWLLEPARVQGAGRRAGAAAQPADRADRPRGRARPQRRPARIVIKVNALTDDQMIRALYRASQAGVPIELIVRGICCLRPGIPGISDNIRVRSIVGRFLEHSRIFWFQNGGQEEMFIGSADLMERNLDRRVETLAPIRDPEILEHLRDVVLGAYLRDTDRAMVLDSSGKYERPTDSPDRFIAQQFLLKNYTEANE